MSDDAVYLYAIGDSTLASSDLHALQGVGGTPVRTVVDAGLAAVVGSVDAGEFSEDSLRRSLEDLRWLEGTARAHHSVVASLTTTHLIAPVRMATVYLDEENVRRLLRDNTRRFAETLDRIRGSAEWGLKGYVLGPDDEPAQEARSDPTAGPGTSYLMRRRAARDRAARARRQSLDSAEEVHREIAALALESRRYPPQDPRLAGHQNDAGHQNEMVLNGAYLVRDEVAARFGRAVQAWDGRPLRLVLTGPWAPYSFATLDGS